MKFFTRKHSGGFGPDHEVTTDSRGRVLFRTYTRQGFGGEYKETVSEPDSARTEAAVEAVGGFFARWIVIVFAAMAVLATIPIWLGGASVAGIVAYLHAPVIARRLSKVHVPEARSVPQSGAQKAYYRLPDGAISAGLGSDLLLFVPILSGVAVSGCFAATFWWAARDEPTGLWTKVMLVGSIVLGGVLSDFVARCVYRDRVNELLLESKGFDTRGARTSGRVWYGVSIALTVIASIMLGNQVVDAQANRKSSDVTSTSEVNRKTATRPVVAPATEGVQQLPTPRATAAFQGSSTASPVTQTKIEGSPSTRRRAQPRPLADFDASSISVVPTPRPLWTPNPRK